MRKLKAQVRGRFWGPSHGSVERGCVRLQGHRRVGETETGMVRAPGQAVGMGHSH